MKKVVILGAGESGVGAALLARAKSYEVFVSDKSQIADQFKKELQYNNIDFEEGKHSLDVIKQADILIKSPGIPDSVPMIQELISLGLDPISEIEFAYKYNSSKIVAITGSNGKTTTTALTHHLFKNSGITASIGGNYGVSFARLLLDKNQPDVHVLELSSFQLDGIRSFKADVSMLLNITPDHLDRYDYKLENYANSKFRVTMNQLNPDLFLYNDDQEICRDGVTKFLIERIDKIPLVKPVSPIRAKTLIDSYDGKHFYEFENEVLQSVHNKSNTQFAVLAAEYLGVSIEHIEKQLESFQNLPHRMEKVGEKDGVVFINDSKATNIDAVYQALSSLESPVVWIAGGTDKGNDYEILKPLVKSKVKALICLGVDNNKIRNAFERELNNIKETKEIDQAVQEAFRLAEGQGTVILSPACASFDLFKNYIDRGDQFRAAVAAL